MCTSVTEAGYTPRPAAPSEYAACGSVSPWRRCARPAGRLSFAIRLGEPNMQLTELFWGDLAGGTHQEIHGLLVHGEHDDVAQVGGASQQHDDAVDARRDAPVRRRAVCERLQ